MTCISSAILWLCLMVSSCQPHCDKETPNDKDFSINMAEHIRVEAGDCIRIPYKLSFLTNRVTAPYKKIWSHNDPSNTGTTTTISTIVKKLESGREDTFRIDGLPHGVYVFSLKLEWGCNQTYVFPKRLHISVSEQKPAVVVSPMKEGRPAILRCIPHRSCSGRARIHWKWTKAEGKSTVLHSDKYFLQHSANVISLTPTADYHNSNITCVAQYDYGIAETTVTLTVKFPPKIVLNDSKCLVEGKLLVCVCVSRGNPLPPITWPSASLTDYSVSSSSSIQTVDSTITMPAAGYHNTTVTCISSNELGRAEVIIPLQNSTQDFSVNFWKQKFVPAIPWIAVVCFSLNLILITSLIICFYKRHRSKQKKLSETMEAYAALRRPHVEEEYSIISSQAK